MHCRTTTVAWLNSGTAWSAKDSDLNQLQMFDLGEVINVTTITIKGRSHIYDYVSGFMIKYGTNSRDFSDYKEVDGSPKLFDANYNSFHEALTSFDQLIIAMYINPQSMLRRELRKHPIYNQKTSLTLDLLLDYNGFHEVIIVRGKRDLVLSMLFSCLMLRPLHRGFALRAEWACHLQELHWLHGEPLPEPLKCVCG